MSARSDIPELQRSKSFIDIEENEENKDARGKSGRSLSVSPALLRTPPPRRKYSDVEVIEERPDRCGQPNRTSQQQTIWNA